MLPVQRAGEGGGGVALAPPPLLSERQRMAQVGPLVQQEVGGLPEDLGSKGPDESRAQEAAKEAEAMSREAPDFVPNDASFLAWLNAQQKGGGGPELQGQGALLRELGAGKEEALEDSGEGTFAPELFGESEPKPAQPGRLARAGRAVKGFFGRVGHGIKGGLSKAGSSIKGGASRAGGAIKEYFSRTEVRDKGQGGIAGGGAVATTVKEGAVQAAPATFARPEDFAQSFTSGGIELAHAIAGFVSIFFSALKAAVDIRSLVSSVKVVQALKKAKQQAKEQAESFAGAGGDAQAMVDMIDYAIRQKYKKIIKRAIGAAVALATVGVALAVLIANPVGASVAALAIGAVSIGMLVYRLGRAGWKRWISKDKGDKRARMASKLHLQCQAGDPLAIEAVRSLHLDPNKVGRSPNGDLMIMRKLKSA